MAVPEPTTQPSPSTEPAPLTDSTPLRAVNTLNFPSILRQLGASLLVSTYQAGKLVIVRDEGQRLNNHFRRFQAPMGVALSGGRLAVGTLFQIWEFANFPGVAPKLEPPGSHD